MSDKVHNKACNITDITAPDVCNQPLSQVDCSGLRHFFCYFNGSDQRYYVRYIDSETGKRVHATRSRFIMMRHTGRKLTRSEIVHHKNGIITDDRIENLEILNRGEHTKMHAREYIDSGRDWGISRRKHGDTRWSVLNKVWGKLDSEIS